MNNIEKPNPGYPWNPTRMTNKCEFLVLTQFCAGYMAEAIDAKVQEIFAIFLTETT